jgi:hypothetical protein
MKMYPPLKAPVPLIHSQPSIFGELLRQDQQGTLDHYKKSYEKSRPPGPPRTSWRIGKVAEKPRAINMIVAYPQEITFREDAWRERFMRDHPLEKLRPVRVKDDLSKSREPVSVDQTLSELLGRKASNENAQADTNAADKVDDMESFIQYQNALVETGMDEEVAYKQACSAFYKNRQLNEQSERDVLMKAQSETEDNKEEVEKDFKPASKAWLEAEQAILDEKPQQ